MTVITANELKTKGVGAIEAALENMGDVVISVRGINKYIITPIESDSERFENETLAAIKRSKADIAAGRYTTDIEAHIREIEMELAR